MAKLTAEEAQNRISALNEFVQKKSNEFKKGLDVTELIMKLRQRRAAKKNKKKE